MAKYRKSKVYSLICSKKSESEKEEVKFKDERDRVQLLEIEFSDIYI